MDAAEVYERSLVPHIFQPWAAAVLQRAGGIRGARVLDVATGTGVGARLAALAAGPTGQVTGLDLDPAMLAMAQRAEATPDIAPLRWVEASALAMPLPDRAFDLAICLEGLQFLPDLTAGLAEIRRVLMPGGQLLASCWKALGANPAYFALSEGLRRFGSEEASRLPPFALAEGDVLLAAAREAGFAIVELEREELPLALPSAIEFVTAVAAGGPSLRRVVARLGEEQRAEFFRFVEQALMPFAGPDGWLRLPSARNVLRAVR